MELDYKAIREAAIKARDAWHMEHSYALEANADTLLHEAMGRAAVAAILDHCARRKGSSPGP